jgi:pyrimidine-specific ribonucleoside hydrolase
MIKNLIFALCFLSVSFLNSIDIAQKQMSVIVDTDMGYDDMMALLSLLKKPNVNVKAITVIGTGLAHPKRGLVNLQRLLCFLNKKNIPIAYGRGVPIKEGHPFPDTWRAENDSLLNRISFLDYQIGNPVSCNAVDLLKEILESSSEKVSILALGPLTNIAELFSLHPNLLKKVEKLFFMGGAVDVPGNLSVINGNTVAEWNVFADPCAAKKVFQLGIPIYLIALDATNHTPLTIKFYEYVKTNRRTRSANLFYELLTGVIPLIQMDGFYFWDVVAAEVFVDSTLAKFELRKIDVITKEGPFSGQTISCDIGYPIHLATHVNGIKCLQFYFDTINSKD